MVVHPADKSHIPGQTAASHAGAIETGLLQLAFGFMLLGGAFLVVFWPTLVRLVSFWYTDPDFSHGFLVPVISVWILFSRRGHLRGQTRGSPWPGFALTFASLGIFFTGFLTVTDFFERIGLIGAILGTVMLVFGAKTVISNLFPFGFLFLAVPPPSVLLGPLRFALKGFATRVAADILFATGFAAWPAGNLLVIGGKDFEVADACSGIRSLLAIVTTAVLLAYLFRTGWCIGILLALTGVPVTIAVNVLRILIVAVALERFQIDLAQGVAHDVLGILVFTVSIACLFAAWRFYHWLIAGRKGRAPAPG